MSRLLRELGVDSNDRFAVARFCEADFSHSPSLTTQADKNEVDINRIVARVQKGLPIPVVNGEAFYGDVSDFGGLQEAVMKVQEAEDLFMAFPADVRERFENDPVQFVEFLEDDSNRDEAVSLGIIKPKPAEAVPEAPLAPPAP